MGNAGYTRDNASYGLTTLVREHVTMRRGEIAVTYPGKSSRTQAVEIADEDTCRASYISPRVIELFEDGVTIAPVLGDLGAGTPDGTPATRGAAEDAVRALLARPQHLRPGGLCLFCVAG
ncbi:hypothetical protein [Yinghuangia soli]|uniref:hypothetical protein n=1 Tax=Yinghuangia soli TaxID=2908204 RepID=UPI0027E34130|nr:hypothetical protein [Yinghuangia soli]